MSRTNDKQRLLLIGATTVVLCGAAGGGIYWASGEVEVARGLIEETRQKIAAADAKIRMVPELERQVITLRETVKEYVKILPERQDLTTFVRAVHTFSSQAGVRVDRIAPAPGGRSAARTGDFEDWTYSFDFSASVWQFLKFTNFLENYDRFVKIKSFSLTAGSNDSAQPGEVPVGDDVQHKVSMVVETYVYTGAASGSPVTIPNYDSKRQALAEDIARNVQAIRLHRYDFRDSRGRRDIFVDPREFNYGDREGGGLPHQQQKKILDEFVGELTRIQAIYDKSREEGITIFERYGLERDLKLGLTEVTKKISDIEQQKVISYQPLKYQWVKNVVQVAEQIQRNMSSVGEAVEDRFLASHDIEALLAAMEKDMASGDLQLAKERFEAVKDRLAVPETDERYPVVLKVQDRYLRTTVAVEFSAQRLDISGVLVNDQGRSGVVLNGVVYQEGDQINEDLLVKAVGREQIEFVYRGFTLIKTR